MSKKIKIAIILVIVAIVIGVLIYANNKKKSAAARLAAATPPKPMSLRDKVKAGIVRSDVKMMPKINISAVAVPFEEQPATT